MDKTTIATIAAGSAITVGTIDNAVTKHRVRKLEKELEKSRKDDAVCAALSVVESSALLTSTIISIRRSHRLSKRVAELEEDNLTIKSRLNDLIIKTTDEKRLADLEAAYKNFFDMNSFNIRLNGLEAKLNIK